VRSAVRNPKTERLQDGAAQSAFEKHAESGRATCRGSMLERSASSARYGPHEFAMSERGWSPGACLAESSCWLLLAASLLPAC